MRLVVQSGQQAGRVIRLEQGMLAIGRGQDCGLVLQDTQASRYHAELRRYGDQWLIVDLGSTNGTILGDARLRPQEPCPLPVGVPVRIGDTQFALEEDWEPSRAQRAGWEPSRAQRAGWEPSRAEPFTPGERGDAEAQPASSMWGLMAWLARGLVAVGSGALMVGSLQDWIRAEVSLPLVGKVVDKTFSGMDSGQAWLFIGVAALALILILIDVLVQGGRAGMAAGLGQALAGVVAIISVASSVYRYYQVGMQEIFGVSLLDIMNQYARDLVDVTIEPGIYLVAGGLTAIIIGGLLRWLVAGLRPH